MVLDTVITSGLTALSLIDDTAGFTDLANPMAVEEYMRSRIAGLQEDARHARVRSRSSREPADAPRWNVRPLLEWFRRSAPAGQGLQPRRDSTA